MIAIYSQAAFITNKIKPQIILECFLTKIDFKIATNCTFSVSVTGYKVENIAQSIIKLLKFLFSLNTKLLNADKNQVGALDFQK